jgi:23S rRNA pseudouridine2605 synthase
VRLQKVLARGGLASRRGGEELIRAGRVAVNGRVVTELGTRVDPARDRVTVDGRRVEVPRGPERHVLLHKPRGVITTRRDPRGRRTVYDLLAPEDRRLVHVGRLDRDAEGLLLLTSDGELAHRLAHPRWQVPKEYRARVEGDVDEERLRRGAREGLLLEDGPTAPFEVEGGAGEWRIVLREGRTHEVKRIFDAVGGRVVRLRRVRLGDLRLGDLAPGRARELRPPEARALERSVRGEPPPRRLRGAPSTRAGRRGTRPPAG